MILGGLQKTTLIDFPGRIACTVFTVGCNFRCPFCHNKDLVSQELFKKSGIESISEEYFFEFLEKKKKNFRRGLHYRRRTDYLERFTSFLSKN